MRCCICGGIPWWAHHVKSVGSGGLDYENLVPLCIDHHNEVERGKKTFATKYDVNLKELAVWYANCDDVGYTPTPPPDRGGVR
jgi:hypothetical protein